MPKGKIIPLPPFIPKFYLGPLPNLKPLPPFKVKPFIEPGPKGEARPFLNPPPSGEKALGISGQELTPQLARFFGVKEGRGILVTQVDKGSPASAADLKTGDVIVRVGSHGVGSMEQLRQALRTQANGNHRVTLGVVRNDTERQMSVLLNPGPPMVWARPIMARCGE